MNIDLKTAAPPQKQGDKPAAVAGVPQATYTPTTGEIRLGRQQRMLVGRIVADQQDRPIRIAA